MKTKFQGLQSILPSVSETFLHLEGPCDLIDSEKPSNTLTCKKCSKQFLNFGDISMHRRLYCKSQVIQILEESDESSIEESYAIPEFEKLLHKLAESENDDDEKFCEPPATEEKPRKIKRRRNRARHEPLCPYCGRKFTKLFSLKLHISHKHQNVYRYCDLCDFKTLAKPFLVIHMKNHHLPKQHVSRTPILSKIYFVPFKVCETCGKSYGVQAILRAHMETHSAKESGMQCAHCSSVFTSRSKLMKHMDVEHLHKTFLCPHCAKDCKSYHGFYYHIKTYHGESNSNGSRYTCEYCKKTYCSHKYLEVHACTVKPNENRLVRLKKKKPEGEILRGRGRPRKHPPKSEMVKRKRGRPRKTETIQEETYTISAMEIQVQNYIEIANM